MCNALLTFYSYIYITHKIHVFMMDILYNNDLLGYHPSLVKSVYYDCAYDGLWQINRVGSFKSL